MVLDAPGSPLGDVPRFVGEHAPEGTLTDVRANALGECAKSEHNGHLLWRDYASETRTSLILAVPKPSPCFTVGGVVVRCAARTDLAKARPCLQESL